MSLKLRWIATVLGFAVVVGLAIVILRGGGERSSSAAALLRADQRTRAFIVGDQAPRSGPLRMGAKPLRALENAVAADLRARIEGGSLRGPVEAVDCRQTGAPGKTKLSFACVAEAGRFAFSYRAAVDLGLRTITLCKFDPGTSGEQVVPVSRRCKE